MSEIRERAKSAQKEMSVTGWDRWANVVTDLLAELERASKWKDAIIDACVVSWVLKKEHENNPKLAVNDLCVWCHSVALDPKVSSEAKSLHGRIAELDANLKHVQGIANATMDKLPERWNMGFQAGLKQAVPHEKDLTNALSEEKKARKDDNAAFTEDILVLESENNRLNTLLHKAYQKTAEDFVEYVKEARIQAARKCVEIAEAMHVDEYGNGQCGEIADLIKSHFKLQEAQK